MLVTLAGIAIAGHLTWAHFADESVICTRRLRDRPGVVVRGDRGDPGRRTRPRRVPDDARLLVWDVPTAKLAAATLAIVGLLFSAYLVVVQLFVIDAICWWCMANDLVVAPALAALTLLRLRS